jgi:hypothetical protein
MLWFDHIPYERPKIMGFHATPNPTFPTQNSHRALNMFQSSVLPAGAEA